MHQTRNPMTQTRTRTQPKRHHLITIWDMIFFLGGLSLDAAAGSSVEHELQVGAVASEPGSSPEHELSLIDSADMYS